MALSTAGRDLLSKHKLEGFLRVADVPPYEEPEKVATKIDLKEISKGTL